ncbi:MAG: ABC transporter permease subunit [Planctomycetia bacterium]|nr:ABC transporter permease subunit [Planctomycetia bacterium]
MVQAEQPDVRFRSEQSATDRAEQPEVRIGSKSFTESVILGELCAHLVESAGAQAVHRRGLGGTGVLWLALRGGEIDVYADYTGTISEEILASTGVRGDEAIRRELARYGIRMSRPLGFNNTYAVGMKKDVAARLGITKVSDLARHPELRLGFTNEFMNRGDGWPSLRDRYRLPQQNVTGLEHALAYQALQNGTLDAVDLYSTDAEIRLYDLAVLDDDLEHFPAYHAVLLYRADLPERAPEAMRALLELEGLLSEDAMVAMNAKAMLDKMPESRVAADFLAAKLALATRSRDEGAWRRLAHNTGNHLLLVAVSLVAAIAIAVPLGILAARRPLAAQVFLGFAGMIQTVPSLALLFFVVGLMGGRIGAAPAIVAVFLYSLLPIVRNTYTGLHDISLPMRESAEALGLPSGARLRLVELPMAARTILAGIKTAAVINVGNATLGGLIGAGGFGQPIFEGLRRYDLEGILVHGAIPAALLALAVQGLFELAERLVVPKGLRLKPEG